MKDRLLIAVLLVMVVALMGVAVGMGVILRSSNLQAEYREAELRTHERTIAYNLKLIDYYRTQKDELKKLVNNSPITPLEAAGVLKFAGHAHQSILDNPEGWQALEDAGYTMSIKDHAEWAEFYKDAEYLMFILARYQ